MSLVLHASLLHLRNWRLLGFCCVPVLLIVALVWKLLFTGPQHVVVTGLVALAAAAYGAGFFLGSSQRELLHRPLSFHQQGLYRRLRLEHGVVAVVLVVVALGVLLNAPVSAAVAWSVASITVVVYAVITLLTLTVPWSSAWGGAAGPVGGPVWSRAARTGASRGAAGCARPAVGVGRARRGCWPSPCGGCSARVRGIAR